MSKLGRSLRNALRRQRAHGIQAAMKNVAGAGGKCWAGRWRYRGVGQYVAFFDTEGNRVGLLQPTSRN
jgi:predicted enzyme related to lactoylglutathione lyase